MIVPSRKIRRSLVALSDALYGIVLDAVNKKLTDAGVVAISQDDIRAAENSVRGVVVVGYRPELELFVFSVQDNSVVVDLAPDLYGAERQRNQFLRRLIAGWPKGLAIVSGGFLRMTVPCAVVRGFVSESES